jgi:hypothetical protein
LECLHGLGTELLEARFKFTSKYLVTLTLVTLTSTPLLHHFREIFPWLQLETEGFTAFRFFLASSTSKFW